MLGSFEVSDLEERQSLYLSYQSEWGPLYVSYQSEGRVTLSQLPISGAGHFESVTNQRGVT